MNFKKWKPVCTHNVYNTYGKVIKVSWKQIVTFIAALPLGTSWMFLIVPKIKGEAFRIEVKE